jgi:hypothetical protein
MRVRTVGVAWYRPEDYERAKAMFKDGQNLPDTFDSWLTTAKKVYQKLAGEGLIVEKAYIDPDTFPEWCRTHGKEMDARGRMDYAREYAARKLAADVQ